MSVDDGYGSVSLNDFVKYAASIKDNPERVTLTFSFVNSEVKNLPIEYRNHGSASLFYSPLSRRGVDLSFMEMRTCPRMDAFEKLDDILKECGKIGLNFVAQHSITIGSRVCTWYIHEQR